MELHGARELLRRSCKTRWTAARGRANTEIPAVQDTQGQSSARTEEVQMA